MLSTKRRSNLSVSRFDSKGMTVHAVIGAALGWFALGLQYALLVRGFDGGAAAATVRFFSFFTILTNTLVAVAYTAVLLSSRTAIARFFTRPGVQSGIALSIALVGVVYSLLLRRIWDPQGWQLVADRLLHDLAPLLYVAFWLMWVPKGGLQYPDAGRWALYPMAYFAYALTQARLTGWYPYPFLDVSALGYVAVLRNAAIILAVFMAAGLTMVAASRRFTRPAIADREPAASR